jgi:hypothetical protein
MAALALAVVVGCGGLTNSSEPGVVNCGGRGESELAFDDNNEAVFTLQKDSEDKIILTVKRQNNNTYTYDPDVVHPDPDGFRTMTEFMGPDQIGASEVDYAVASDGEDWMVDVVNPATDDVTVHVYCG